MCVQVDVTHFLCTHEQNVLCIPADFNLQAPGAEVGGRGRVLLV